MRNIENMHVQSLNTYGDRLPSLQVSRAIAATMVVLYHADALFSSPKYWNHQILRGIFEFGYSGVEFFFVLSGFIILHAHRLDIGNNNKVKSYLFKRFIRVYPLYWIITIVVIVIMLFSHGDRIALWNNSILLFGSTNEAVLGVGWTLFHEVVFYLFFALVIVKWRIGAVAMTMWLTACAACLIFTPPHYALAPINLLFGLGMLASVICERWRLPWSMAICIVGAIGFLAVGLEDVYWHNIHTNLRQLAYGFSSALIVVGGVSLDRTQRVRMPQALTMLGDASYVLYLIHYPLLSLLAKIMRMQVLQAVIPVELAFVMMVGICCVSALGVHVYFERPLLKWLRKRFASR